MVLILKLASQDASANLTISSPLEAHKANAIIQHVVGVDVGFENPLFAALEVDYSEADQDPTGEAFNNAEKLLTYYELDLGLNHVVRRWSEPVDPRANLLVQVPGGKNANDKWDGPSGVLVCCEDMIVYRHQGAPEHRVPIPRRGTPWTTAEKGTIIVAAVMHKMRVSFVDSLDLQLSRKMSTCHLHRVHSSSCCNPKMGICSRSRLSTTKKRSWRYASSILIPSRLHPACASSSSAFCLLPPKMVTSMQLLASGRHAGR